MSEPTFHLYAVVFGDSFGGITLALDQDDAKFKAVVASGFLDQGDYIANVPGMTSIKSRETAAKWVVLNRGNVAIPSGVGFLPCIMCFAHIAKVGEHWYFETTDYKPEFIILPTIEDVHSDLDTCQINKRDLWFCSDWSENFNEL